MIRNKYGFSFVEIIVVVSILVIIGGFSLSSISSSFEKQSLLGEVNTLKNTLKSLENDLGKEITDYELSLLTGSRYYYTTNKNYKNVQQSLSLSGNSWTIKTNDTLKNNLDLNLFMNDKKINSYSFSSTGSFSGTFTSTGRHTLHTVGSDYTLNDIFIHPYAYFDMKKDIQLITISDGSGNTYTGVKIANSIGKSKIFYTSSGNIINSVLHLRFEYKGNPLNLQIP